MKKTIQLPRFLLMLLIILYGGNCYAATKIALVIGNGAYRDSPLKNPVNDADLIEKTLIALDFEVVKHLDASQKNIKRAIRDFGDKLEQAGNDSIGLFYYSGHGIQTNGTNYLIPINAQIRRESDVGIEAVPASSVLDVLDYARNRLNFVILDACRNNPFARSFRSADRGLARMSAPQGTLVAYATAPGEVARDGDGKNSPYTSALTKMMTKPNLAVEQMFKIVRREVMATTQNNQIPWESSSLTADFYFSVQNGSDSIRLLPEASIPQSEIDREALFWNSIRESENTGDYQEYLRQFPTGLFVALANNKIHEISGETTLPAAQQETIIESIAQQPDSPAADTAVSPGAPSPPLTRRIRVDESEQNNSFGTADPVSYDSLVHGRISPIGDNDWYQINVRQQGEINLIADNIAPELDLVVRVWNADKYPYSDWIKPLRKGASTEGYVDLKQPGDYFLEVADSGNDASSDQPYHLNLQFTPSMDAAEPNDAYGTATSMENDHTWWPTILPGGDEDWYQIEVSRQGELNIDVTEVPENLDVAIRVWNSNKYPISGWFSPLKNGGNTAVKFDLPLPGKYVIQMSDGKSDARSVKRFKVDMRFQPSVDLSEPNNDFGSASKLAIGEPIKATQLPAKDIDWYRIHVDEQGQLDINITNVPQNLDIFYRFWNSDKYPVSGWVGPLKEGGDTIGSIDLATAGTYIMEVHDGKQDNRSIEPYTLKLGFTPSKDRSEPNNGFKIASPLKLGSSINATILPKGDSDWYRISAPRSGELKVIVSNVAENLDIHARLWNSEKYPASNWIAPLKAGGDTTGNIAIPGAGSYILEVVDGKNNARSTEPYSLRISM